MQLKTLVLVLMVPLLTGCSEPEAKPEDPIVWGLGLDLPAELPPPGPFLEDDSELQHLFAFANESIRPMFDRCEHPDRPERFVSNLAAKRDMYAFIHLRDVCEKSDSQASRAAAMAAIANGTEVSEFQARSERMNATLDALVDALHALPTPRTRTDAEFHAWIARYVHERILYREGAISNYQSYIETKGQQYAEMHLINAFRTTFNVPRYAEAYLHFMQDYDWTWQDGACALPAVEAAHAEIQASYDRALELAQDLADPDDAQWISTFYGDLVKIRKPSIAFYAREGFVPALLHLQHDLDFQVAYWENLTTDRRPTLEEAEWLIADHHARGRALAMEDVWTNEYAVMKQADFWEADPDTAVRPIALQAVHWRFADLQC